MPVTEDDSLDIAKAVAIVLVILGHELQDSSAQFDNIWLFRAIYAFHMPFFMFLSGVSAGFWVRRLGPEVVSPSGAWSEISAKALRLLVPFVAWSVVAYLVQFGFSGDPITWTWQLLVSPDRGLWFLPVPVECWVVLVVLVLAKKAFPELPAWLWILGGLITHGVLRVAPVPFGLGALKWYFQFFYLGAITTFAGHQRWPAWVTGLALGVFCVLLPFWQRIDPVPQLVVLPFGHVLNEGYRELVGFSGVIAATGLSYFLADALRGRIRDGAAFVGRRTLDIYVLHFYFVGMVPPVIGPLAASLIASQILRLSGVSRTIFFGERPMGLIKRQAVALG